jgi:hypothetical protein
VGVAEDQHDGHAEERLVVAQPVCLVRSRIWRHTIERLKGVSSSVQALRFADPTRD